MDFELIKITDYENYAVSKCGRVWSFKREMFLKLSPRKDGYLRVNIYNNKGRKTVNVHRLVGLYFVDNPRNMKELNHIDGNKMNNHANNLEWCSRSENIKHAYSNNLKSNKGENHPRNKLTKKDVKSIRRLLRFSNLTHKQISEKFKVDRSTITDIHRFKTWKNIE
ncbi:MAG: NUMOD4 domain-containing protein [Nitrososphaeraceae archaeon]|nr:NUMOD4 domain-containing protein [Nitrososphaeraceae archaeon]